MSLILSKHNNVEGLYICQLGGCSNLNYMGYTQTTAGALQQWADAVGDDSYAYESSSYYYRKSMNFTAANTDLRLPNATTSEEVDTAATGGPLGVTYSSWVQSFSTYIAIAMDALGIHNTDAFINGRLNGSSWLTSTINADTGHRESAQVAYLDPAVNRPNLQVFDLTLGERIIFDDDKVARGVVVTTENRTYTLAARREVIVSAGAFQSPQLLQVSGVGPADLLREHDIPVVADRPGVGSNMQDHVFFGISYRVNVPTASALQYGDAQQVAQTYFNANGTGPLASPGGDYAGYEKLPEDIRDSFADTTVTELEALPDDWPEMQYLTLPTYVGDFQTISAGSPDDGYMYATLLATLVAPSSLGNISISSSSMSDQPLINPNWMTTQRDVDLVIGGFKRLRQILESPSMANVTIGSEYYPGARVESDSEIHSQIQQSFNTMYHAAASCKMGLASDPEAVVDNNGRVYGVSNCKLGLLVQVQQKTTHILGKALTSRI